MSASYRRRRSRLGPERAHYVLYAGVMIFLVLTALTIREIRSAWNQARARSRAEAVFDLVQERTPKRPTDKPGAIAWLDREMRRYERRRSEGEQATPPADRLSVSSDPGPVPAVFASMTEALVDAMSDLAPAPAGTLRMMGDDEVRPPGLETPDDRMQFRSQRFLDYRPVAEERGRWLVLTRRRAFDQPNAEGNGSDRFLRWAAAYLEAARQRIEKLPPIPGRTPPKLIRIYALAEDGTFVSLPWVDTSADTAARRAATWHEGLEFRKRPLLPNFVPNEFFFRFDYERPGGERPGGQAHHSGLYLDLGGYGLATTVTVPARALDPDLRAVIAIDLTLEVDWQRFAAAVETPLIAHLARLETPGSGGWQPWSELQQAVADQRQAVPPRLGEVLSHLAEEERRTGTEVFASADHHRVVPGLGALAVFQVSKRDWLMVFFPEIPTRFPVLAVSLLVFLGLMLLGGFELNRRRAEAAQLRAERELRERQSLYNAMRIPMAVVDPNTDQVVSGNDAAAAIGIIPGSSIGDLVTGDDAREHYERMQRARGDKRRAYGVPLAVAQPGESAAPRLALIRSIAIKTPIASFQADERHRLGILFLVEPETDLPLYTRAVEQTARDDERRRLAGLLSHGIDTLAHVLAARLRGAPASRPRLEVVHDPVRRELAFSVSNALRSDSDPRPEADRKPYGGIAIITRLAHLFGWRDLRFEHGPEIFAASWRVPVSERSEPDDSD